ncbi:MAG: hypothetical protein M9924_21710 [Rhizobiaceae bacterium]|nr:hypothetical protein [Rhizobiaceae bacterium]
MYRVLFILVSVVLTLAAAFLYFTWGPSFSWNQKLTLKVETPDGLKVGSSVSRVSLRIENNVPGIGRKGTGGVKGEAAFVEVAPGRYLFAVLTNAETIAQETFRDETGFGREDVEIWATRLENLREERNVSRPSYPLLVTFDDVSNPASVRRVNPDDLTAAFGLGTKLRSISLTITDEAVTEGLVETVLGWLETVGRDRGTLIPDPPRIKADASDPAIQYLSPSAFSTFLYK